MSKNIIIFSDGTGQRGGVLFDECRSNIYKLYRATRCGPDSSINPAEQLTYYDPGIGTEPGGMSTLGRVWRKFQNLISQATGLGLTTNIIECYTAILQMWEKGDRIYLFGFSRGAYTVRCVAAVIAFCGIPRIDASGNPLKRDQASCRRLAEEAVKKVYQHVSSPKDTQYVQQRKDLAARYKKSYRSENIYPYFIGVFDTVAAVGRADAIWLASFVSAALTIVLAGILAAVFEGGFLYYLLCVSSSAAITTLAGLLYTNLRWATGLENFSFLQTVHVTSPRLRFYDNSLNENVGFARHAIAIDEHRGAFDRVTWGNKGDKWRETLPGEPPWLRQYWFAGNHSDIGGSYPENEARLSDIALKWMVEQALEVPDSILVDERVLNLHPDPLGMQHDEGRSWLFKRNVIDREIDPKSILHDSVHARLEAPAVLHYDEFKKYDPYSLRNHLRSRTRAPMSVTAEKVEKAPA